MLSFLIPKPPVPAVPNAVHSASKRGIFPASKNNILKRVSTIYSTYSIMAVSRILGTSLPTSGPGLSAFKRCSREPPDFELDGTMASKNTSTPIPPSQWLKLRQYKIPRDKSSTTGTIDAPVVVKPETISKNASM